MTQLDRIESKLDRLLQAHGLEQSAPLTRVTFNETFGRNFVATETGFVKGTVPVWRDRFRWPRKDVINGELQVYAAFNAWNFSLTKSGLSILAQRDSRSPDEFSSGVITTEKLFKQQYGWFEMKARLPKGPGLAPAFWLYPADEIWPPEIDIMEANGQNWLHVAVHQTLSDSDFSQFVYADKINVHDGKYHKFACEWRKDFIAFYLDDVKYAEVFGHGVHEPMYLIINLAVGSDRPEWIPHPPADAKFPAALDIEYVRVMN